MRHSIFSSLPVLALISMMTVSVFAAEKPAKEKPKTPGEVTAVDDKSISVVLYGTKEAKYTVTDTTKVTVDYKPAKIGDVKVGMKAQVGHKAPTSPGGAEEATSISATTMKKGKGK